MNSHQGELGRGVERLSCIHPIPHPPILPSHFFLLSITLRLNSHHRSILVLHHLLLCSRRRAVKPIAGLAPGDLAVGSRRLADARPSF